MFLCLQHMDVRFYINCICETELVSYILLYSMTDAHCFYFIKKIQYILAHFRVFYGFPGSPVMSCGSLRFSGVPHPETKASSESRNRHSTRKCTINQHQWTWPGLRPMSDRWLSWFAAGCHQYLAADAAGLLLLQPAFHRCQRRHLAYHSYCQSYAGRRCQSSRAAATRTIASPPLLARWSITNWL